MESETNSAAPQSMASSTEDSKMPSNASQTDGSARGSQHRGNERGLGRGRGRGNERGGSRGRGRGPPGRASSGRGRHGRNEEKSSKSRAEWSRDSGNRRERNEESKRRRIDRGEDGKPIYAVEFSKDEIESDERRPKRKVAVLIGYSGSGYKGLQLSDTEKTIEGELFQAFVAAGAISKANADDPKKSSLVRCARTDKGVHAAGNVISLKLIIEDPDIVKKINDSLSPQIRVWGMERTNGSFSAYQLCDSRIYEYLIPTHCFLPPHPKSFLGKKMAELADEAGDRDGYDSRQKEVETFWADTEEKVIKPILDEMDPRTAAEAMDIIFGSGLQRFKENVTRLNQEHHEQEALKTKGKAPLAEAPAELAESNEDAPLVRKPSEESPADPTTETTAPQTTTPRTLTPIELAVRRIKAAYQTAKLSHRIPPSRLSRVRSCLSRYVGTHNYHNYTTGKLPRDPSAQRVMKSFVAGPSPIMINSTEWLSLKVHGQSFMMHQIRKMVCLCAMVVRCGTHEGRIQDTFTHDSYTIPKAPGLGLLLERPVFETYNKKVSGTAGEAERMPLDFAVYEAEMEEFKQREIYERIFREEERDGTFHGLTGSMDSLRSGSLLYLSSVGHGATKLKLERDGDWGRSAEEVLGSDGEDEEPADS